MNRISAVLGSKRFMLLARIILGGTFVCASLGKIASPREFAAVVADYHILPDGAAIFFAFLLPWVEFFLGAFLIAGLFVRESAFILSGLLLVFSVAMIVKALNGGIVHCGCFSVKPGSGENIFILVGRDAGLLACGLWLALKNLKSPSRRIAATPADEPAA